MGEWCFMKSFYFSTTQDKENAKCPTETKVKWVSKIMSNLFNLRKNILLEAMHDEEMR